MEWGGGNSVETLRQKERGWGGGVSVRIWVNLSGVGIERIGEVDFANTN